MFKGTRDIMVKSTKPMPEVVKTIEECGHFIGTVSVTDSGNISSSASRFDGFGYVPEISGSIFEKGKGKYNNIFYKNYSAINIDRFSKAKIGTNISDSILPFGETEINKHLADSVNY